MKRVLFSLLLILSIFVPPLRSAPPPSIVAIQTASGQNFCTAFSINKKQHYFGTAAHCVNPDNPMLPAPYVFFQRVQVVALNEDLDIAVIRVVFGAEALKIGEKAPRIGDFVSVTGHPHGLNLMTFIGKVVSTDTRTPDGKHFQVFDMTVAPGNSGSPVFNKDGKVVSVLQVMWPRSGGMAGGALFGDMTNFFEPFIE